MSYSNAIKYRSTMNETYRKLLATTTSDEDRSAIQKQIDFNLKEIEQLKEQQYKIFGKKEPLKPTTTIIEKSNLDNLGEIKTTIINAPKVTTTPPTPSPSTSPTPKRLGNKLRQAIHEATAPSEDSLKAKIAAAKAAKKAN